MHKFNNNFAFAFDVKWQMWIKLLNLIWKSYIRSFSNIFFGYVQPVFLFAIFYFIFTLKLGVPAKQLVASYILLAPITSSLISFSNMLSEWKSSVLLKRLDVTPISKYEFMLTLIIFFFVISFISAFWMMLWSLIFIEAQGIAVNDIFGSLNWGWLVLTIVQLVVICNMLAILVAGLAGGNSKTQAIVMSIYFPCVFLGGVIISPEIIDQEAALKWISYFLPFKYPVMLSRIAWFGVGAIDLNFNGKSWTEFPNVWLPIVVGFVYAGIIFAASIKTFKWTIRS